jgi:hypothetical protein
MPVNYTLRDHGTFLHVRATGRFTVADIRAFLASLAADSNVKADHVTLFDTTKAEFGAIGDDEFAEVLSLVREHPLVARKMAILVKDRRFARHGTMFQNAPGTGGERAEVFTSLVEATNWLSR